VAQINIEVTEFLNGDEARGPSRIPHGDIPQERPDEKRRSLTFITKANDISQDS